MKKKAGSFHVTMGVYNGAEVCELSKKNFATTNLCLIMKIIKQDYLNEMPEGMTNASTKRAFINKCCHRNKFLCKKGKDSMD